MWRAFRIIILSPLVKCLCCVHSHSSDVKPLKFLGFRLTYILHLGTSHSFNSFLSFIVSTLHVFKIMLIGYDYLQIALFTVKTVRLFIACTTCLCSYSAFSCERCELISYMSNFDIPFWPLPSIPGCLIIIHAAVQIGKCFDKICRRKSP